MSYTAMEVKAKISADGVEETKAKVSDVADTGEKTETRLSSAFKKIALSVATYFAFDKVKDFGKACLEVASDSQEMENKFNVVFGDLSGDVDKWATNYADKIGRSRDAIKGYLADNQNMIVGMGATREQASQLSENMVSLGLDLASFNNLSEDDAVNALSKAMMGETESAKRLGAVLNDNTRALAMEQLGYKGKFDALSETQKMEVNYQAILNQSKDAVGDCERSVGSYKDTQIRLQSATYELQKTIGGLLLPIFSKLNTFLTGLVKGTKDVVIWFTKHKDMAKALGIVLGTLATAFGLSALGITTLTGATGVWSAVSGVATSVTTALGGAFALLTSPISLIVLAIGGLIALGTILYSKCDGFRAFIDGFVQKIGAWVEVAKGYISVGLQAISNVFKVVLPPIATVVKTVFGIIKNTIVVIITALAVTVGTTWNLIRDYIVKPIQSAWKTIQPIINTISSTIGRVFNGIKTTTSNVWNGVKSAIEKPINKAKDIVKTAIDTIKGFFNFKIKWPKIPMPHFTVKPKGWEIGDLLKGKIPTLGIDWKASAMKNGEILNNATIFGAQNGRLLGGGEVGSETVVGTQSLMGMIRTTQQENMGAMLSVLNQVNAKLSSDYIYDTMIRLFENGEFMMKLNDREVGRLIRNVG